MECTLGSVLGVCQVWDGDGTRGAALSPQCSLSISTHPSGGDPAPRSLSLPLFTLQNPIFQGTISISPAFPSPASPGVKAPAQPLLHPNPTAPGAGSSLAWHSLGLAQQGWGSTPSFLCTPFMNQLLHPVLLSQQGEKSQRRTSGQISVSAAWAPTRPHCRWGLFSFFSSQTEAPPQLYSHFLISSKHSLCPIFRGGLSGANTLTLEGSVPHSQAIKY